MDYLGVKTKLNDWIFKHILHHLEDVGLKPEESIFLDACAGTGAVSVEAARRGFQIVACDVMAFSYHTVRGKLLLPDSDADRAQYHIDQMNLMDGEKGFFSTNYSALAGRSYFTDGNAARIDGCRQYIRSLGDAPLESYLLYCLLEAMSRVSNTAGTYGAYLKEVKERAKQRLTLKMESRGGYPTTEVYHRNVVDLLNDPGFRGRVQEQVLYIDPPYTSRQYAPNYHIYETLVRNDTPELHGTTGLRELNDAKSEFCAKDTALKALTNILQATRAQVIAVSYSSDGIMSPLDIEEAMFRTLHVDTLEVHAQRYGRYKADKDSSTGRKFSTDLLREYLFVASRPADALGMFG